MHARGAADREHTPAPCLRSEESTRMRRGTLQNGSRQWLVGEKLLNKVFILGFFWHTKSILIVS